MGRENNRNISKHTVKMGKSRIYTPKAHIKEPIPILNGTVLNNNPLPVNMLAETIIPSIIKAEHINV